PKTAMSESPMYLSTVPPCSATTSAMRRKAASTVRATASGSVFSAIDVNPTTSANSTVANLRSPAAPAVGAGAGAASPRAEPHWPQKRCPGGLSNPQDGHGVPPSSVPHDPQNRKPLGFWAPHDEQAIIV